jgi:hypothetical protein
MRLVLGSGAFAANKDPVVAQALRTPSAEIYVIDVSFSALKDKKELEYLNLQPTRSCSNLRPWTGCAPRAARSSWIRRSSSAC